MNIFEKIGSGIKSAVSNVSSAIGKAGNWLNENGATLLNGALNVGGSLLTGNVGDAIAKGTSLISGFISPVDNVGLGASGTPDLQMVALSSASAEKNDNTSRGVVVRSGSASDMWGKYEKTTLETILAIGR